MTTHTQSQIEHAQKMLDYWQKQAAKYPRKSDRLGQIAREAVTRWQTILDEMRQKE